MMGFAGTLAAPLPRRNTWGKSLSRRVIVRVGDVMHGNHFCTAGCRERPLEKTHIVAVKRSVLR